MSGNTRRAARRLLLGSSASLPSSWSRISPPRGQSQKPLGQEPTILLCSAVSGASQSSLSLSFLFDRVECTEGNWGCACREGWGHLLD